MGLCIVFIWVYASCLYGLVHRVYMSVCIVFIWVCASCFYGFVHAASRVYHLNITRPIKNISTINLFQHVLMLLVYCICMIRISQPSKSLSSSSV